MSQQASETAVRKSVSVNCPTELAFRVFTERVGSWWPFEKVHSISEDEVETVVLEDSAGGRFYERTKSGEELLWGTVLIWDPPHRLVYSWHPGRGEDTAQQVEVTFTPEGDGTRVELVHTGWERLGDRMAETVASYETGWDTVLGGYVAAANRTEA
jgi:uncharacterized protein YndB with AHSA1/START domain